ncbi:hypothetical protein [Luteolibacter luteus]|uniref:DUF1648 domain-containing protein n=1 Tax=Luteolibacter luteus TaxID=2728835 RepID=A0A858RJA9_9BACT|nr:hypothetical protein [Luteolibacter luteus]QJE96671.1 hypothetical protein HHL09_13050 [Luteolibacter luteus]
MKRGLKGIESFLIVLSMVVPGIAMAAMRDAEPLMSRWWGSDSHAVPATILLTWLLVVLGCTVFAGKLLASTAEERRKWEVGVHSVIRLILFQIVLTPGMAMISDALFSAMV